VQVRWDRSHAFWEAVLGGGYQQHNLRAMVIDTLQIWFLAYADRLNNTHRHEEWMDGYLGPSGGAGSAGGASRWRLPVRVDQSLPSDHLASALRNWPAVVSARIGSDMDGADGSGFPTSWTQMASSGAFLAALHLRPIMDVLWTTPVQPENTEHLLYRYNTEHELVVATLTCGPVGFGDAAGHTNASMLRRASRQDGTILKPAHPIYRTDAAAMGGGADGRTLGSVQIWETVSTVARHVSSRGDERANSFASLDCVAGCDLTPSQHWWRILLVTSALSAPIPPLTTASLWPTPHPNSSFLVSDDHGAACVDGATPRSCLAPLSSQQPLDLSAASTAGDDANRMWRLLSAAPVLRGGWALVGEATKYVRVSPQRLVRATRSPRSAGAGAARARDGGEWDGGEWDGEERDGEERDGEALEGRAWGGSDVLEEDEVVSRDGRQLAVDVIGAAGEAVQLTLVRPAEATATQDDGQRLARALAGSVEVVSISIPAAGRATVRCVVGASCVLGA
jgi:hypothetical protein